MELGIYLEKAPDPAWMEELKKNAWQVKILENGVNFVDKREALVLTDVENVVTEAAKQGIPVIYHQRPEAKNVYQGDLTILDLTEVDKILLERVFQRHWGLPWQIAETDRLLIRESVPEDLEGLLKLYEGRETLQFLDPPESADTEREKLSAYIRYQYPFYGYGLYTVLEKSTGEIVGRAGFENRELDNTVFLELGYLIRQDRRGLGYALEAALALGECLEELTGETNVTIFCHRENTPSVHLAQKLTEKCPRTFQIRFFP